MAKPRIKHRSNVRNDGLTPGQERAIRALLIRIAIDYAFRSAVYCDVTERVKALEKAQRQSQPAGRQSADNTRPNRTPKRSHARQQADFR